MHRAPTPQKTSKRGEKLLVLAHTDIGWAIECSSIGGSKYFITCLDGSSNWVMAFPIQYKSQCIVYYLNYEKTPDRQRENHLSVKIGRDGKCHLSRLAQILKNVGFKQELTIALATFQKGAAERLSKTLGNLVRVMPNTKNLPKALSYEALDSAIYITITVTCKALPVLFTPHPVWKRNIAVIIRTGCLAPNVSMPH